MTGFPAGTSVSDPGSLDDLLASLASGFEALRSENEQLQARVTELSAPPVPDSTEVRAELPFDRWIAAVSADVEAWMRHPGRRLSEAEDEQLRLLVSVVDFLARPSDRPQPRSPAVLSVVPRSTGTPSPAEVTPESVLSGPTADAPPHRIRRVPPRRSPIPGMEGVRLRPRRPLYEPTWLDRAFPWLNGLLLQMDPFVGGVEKLWGSTTRGISSAVGAVSNMLPLPGAVRRWLWLGARPSLPPGARSASLTERSRWSSILAAALIVSTGLHFAVFSFWPTIEAEDFSFTVSELSAIEVPPEVEIPPPPQQISRPATPVMASSDFVDEDVTIAPTTFEENPPEELPPPPPASEDQLAEAPTFTPFTVAPRIVNGEEVANAMRSEYPASLREAGVGGVVLVWFFIDEEGTVQDARIFQSSGYEALDQAALEVAARVEFTAALDGDRRVPVWVQFPLTFQVR